MSTNCIMKITFDKNENLKDVHTNGCQALSVKQKFIVIGDYPEDMYPGEREDMKVLSIQDNIKDANFDVEDLKRKGFRDVRLMNTLERY